MRRMAVVAAWAALASGALAQEWTRFRGPNGSGVSAQKGVPIAWTEKDFAWKTPLPGRGHSSPVLWGDKVFVTAADAKGKRFAVCVDAVTGKTLWEKTLDGAAYKMHKRNSIATSTPAVDAERVYLLWGTPKEMLVWALDHRGETVWKIDLGPFHGNHGIGVSPILVGDRLIVANEQDDRGSLLALDARSGTKVWETPRQKSNATYSTPCTLERAGKTEIVFTNWKHGITGVDATTGKVAWETSVFEPNKQERAIVSPLVAGDLVLGTCGFVTAQKHFVAVKPGTGGSADEVWRVEKSVAHLATPIVVGPHVFSFTEKGIVTCAEVRSGKQLWQERIEAEFSASPVCAGDVIYATADDGDVYVVKAAPTYTLLSRNPLGYASQATPAIAGGRVIFRTEQHLIALSAK